MKKSYIFVGAIILLIAALVAYALPNSNSRAESGQPVLEASTSTPQLELAPTATPIVPTLQVPWTPVPEFVAQAEGLIDWDELALMGDWVKGPGLTPDVDVLYVQSGVPNSVKLPGLPFVVPNGEHLIFGALSASLSIEDNDGKVNSYDYGSGFYAAIPGGTNVTNLVVNNGFALLVADQNAENEFCNRVSQAYAEDWAHSHLYHSPAWTAPVCAGIYSVPLDSDR
ncbi:MAG TPA: hypothetical protein VFI61_02155 [Patescibacteria group bacterium]|nr:hypothetical protein [Patescibacteria group bacterium]